MSKHTDGPWEHAGARIGTDGYGIVAEFFGPAFKENACLGASAPDLLEALKMAISACGHSLSGPTDARAAEDGEPAWVCHARGVIAHATREG